MTNKKENCLTGACPVEKTIDEHVVKLSEGSGGREMQNLIDEIRKRFPKTTTWQNITSDGASITILGDTELVFTTDSYVVTPIFFPGGDIGKIAFCGTVNDLAVMGAQPLGISLSLIIEEGMNKDDLFKLIDSIAKLSKETGIPIVTGDTKVVERGALDKIVINTAGVGTAKKVLNDEIQDGDHIIVSGGIGEHGTALLAKRYELEASIESCSKPLHEELAEIAPYIRQAKDVTRGGLAAILNEFISNKKDTGILIHEESIKLHEQVRALTEILGIEVYSLACEGRFVCVVSKENSEKVLTILKKYNKLANIIGEVTNGDKVVVQTTYGKKILSMPSGNIVPRIC